MMTADERAGGNLRRYRERAGLSQAELARRMAAAGYPWQQSTVNRAETGAQPLRAGELETLAGMFGVPVDAFFLLEGEAAELDIAGRVILTLREAAEEAAEAVRRLHQARDGAKRAAEDADRSSYQSVRETAEALRAELRGTTLKGVLAEAAARHRKDKAGD